MPPLFSQLLTFSGPSSECFRKRELRFQNRDLHLLDRVRKFELIDQKCCNKVEVMKVRETVKINKKRHKDYLNNNELNEIITREAEF